MTILDVANSLHINHGSAYEIFHNRLGYNKVSARWVPKHLTILLKQMCFDISQYLLCHNNDKISFLDRIITGDETWLFHYKPENKHQTMKSKHQQLSTKKKFKTQPSEENWCLPKFFWNWWGLLLGHYQERGPQINSSHYSGMLDDCLKPAIHSNH